MNTYETQAAEPSLRVMACRYAATLQLQAAGKATEEDVRRAMVDLERAAIAHVAEVRQFVNREHNRDTCGRGDR